MSTDLEYKIKSEIEYNSECETEVPSEDDYDWDKLTIRFDWPVLYVRTRAKQYYFITYGRK